ncbi:MAG: lectin like domain-containing protein [Elusimicrobia bacterium]|nr:lectin like domain-containing protein [Elusimicrobiota bacterium]
MRYFCVFFVAFFLILSNISAQGLIRAPLNPDFIKLIDKKTGIQSAIQIVGGFALGYRPSPLDLSHLKTPSTFKVQEYAVSYDLRAQDKLTFVKDQGDTCGSCWTFAALGSIESVLLPGENWNFSENNLKNTHGFDWGHCDGGNQDMSIAYLARWDGPKLDSEDPYDMNFPYSPTSPVGLTTQKHLQEALYIPSRTSSLDNDGIKSAILTYGAVDSSMYWNDLKYNAANKAYYYDGPLVVADHAVVIVGWNNDYPAANFSPAAPPGNGAFIIRNSWGADWGESGYFYISYHDGNLGREVNVVYNVISSTSNYARVYQYDHLGWTSDTGYDDPVAYMANIFTAGQDENLSAVSFYTNDISVSYEVKVYGNVNAGQPISGALLATASGSFADAGYHTVSISPSLVTSGQKFSIIVKLTNSSYGFPIAIEEPIADYSSLASAYAGESYVSEDGIVWEDITDTDNFPNSNACIKVFAQSDTTPPSDVTAVNDGAGADIAYVNSLTQLSANWSAATDGESGIAKYWYAIGTSAGATNTVDWTDNGLNLTVTKTGLNLTDGLTYYFTVKAENGIGLESSIANSNGQLADITSPTAKIEISSPLPAKSGTLEFKLIINEANQISGNPSLSFTGSDGIDRNCSLSHLVSSTWTGTAFIESYISTGAAVFSFSATDAAGNIGSVITDGSSFNIATSFDGNIGSNIVNSDGTSIIFPAGGYAGTLIINISTPAPASLVSADLNTHNSFAVLSADLAKEFIARDMAYNPITVFSGFLTLKIYYPDADNNGRVDGDNVLESTLGLYYLDESLQKWILANDMVANFTSNYLQAETNHFSVYSIRYIGSAQSDMSRIKAYPNPCRMTISDLTFEGIPVPASGVKIYIYNSAGNLIRTLDRNDGINALNIAVWNGRNKSGKKAASGLYVYIIKTAEYGTSSGKFVISW